VQTSASGDGDGLDDKLVLAQRRLDKAASKGVIHKNQAARRTSRLMKKATASAE
jgi:small subunit ribosomal protein S20